MFVVIGGFLGAILGGLTARRRKGNRADIAQYAVVYAMGFALIGLFVTIFVHRMSL
ncbi:MAG: apolipoprotein acyltransferase [Pseudomonadota bacterium]